MCYEKTSRAMEFYGLKIPMEDSNKLSSVLANLSEADREILIYRWDRFSSIDICPLKNALYEITSAVDKCKDMAVIIICDKNNRYVLLGRWLNHSTATDKYAHMNLTTDPVLNDNVLKNMKVIHNLLEIDNAFESYEVVHKVYHVAQ